GGYIAHRDGTALCRQLTHEFAAHPGAAAGYHGDPAGEVFHRFPPSRSHRRRIDLPTQAITRKPFASENAIHALPLRPQAIAFYPTSRGRCRASTPSGSRNSCTMVKWLAPATGISAPGKWDAERASCSRRLSDTSGGSSAVPYAIASGLFTPGSRSGERVAISWSVSRSFSFRTVSRNGPSSKIPEIARPAFTSRCPRHSAVRCPPADQPDSTTFPLMPCAGPCAASQFSAASISAAISLSDASGASV